MGKNKVATKAISIFMSVALIVGLMPLPSYADVAKGVESLSATAESADSSELSDDATSSSLDELEEEAESLSPSSESIDSSEGDEAAADMSADEMTDDSEPLSPSDESSALAESSEPLMPQETESVSYVERSWNGSQVVSSTKTVDATPVPGDANMSTGWYYLKSDVTKKGRVNLTGNVNLILGDGCTLNVRGLYVPKGSTLTIYGQEGGTGRVYSHPSDGAAIGAYKKHKGGAVVIHGGRIDAEGADHCAAIGANDDDRTDVGAITIYGGTVHAEGGDSGAGLGGGRACEGGVITIYGGDVTAEGGHYAAGIGGGNGQDTNPMRGAHAGTISIYGGTVHATGGDDGAGIGGGEGGNAGTILINGGEVTARGGNNSAGIGCGEGESTGIGGNVTINGGTIIANGGEDAAGIGGGDESHCDTVTINGGSVTATGGECGAGIGAGRDTDGGTIRITGGTVRATGIDSSAGIGGADASGSYADYSIITITGGDVTAQGNSKGAGIGGGEYGHATITIVGGTVSATGGSSGGSGIGNGKDGKGSATILGWSEATKDAISITASSYSGLVRLNQPFKDGNDGRFKVTEAVADLGALAAHPPLTSWSADAVPTSVEVSTWSGLQEAINGAEGVRTIKLTSSVSAAAGEGCIRIPADKSITIDLNGKVMNRGLSSCVDQGSVIQVESNATLTVVDSSGNDSGVITGGAALRGGGICNNGVLYFKGGTIRGNRASSGADGAGGGIYSSRLNAEGPNAELYLTGGSIEGNESYNGGGVYVGDSSAVEMSGLSITGNSAGGQGGGVYDNASSSKIKGGLTVSGNTGGNVYLRNGRFLAVAGNLSSGDSIGVTMENPSGSITSGLKGRGDASNFFSDNPAYSVLADGTGEAYLYKLPDYQVSSWDELQAAVNSATEGQVIQLSGDVINTAGKTRIKVTGKNIVIDLNGHTVDRRRTSSDSDGHVFELLSGTVLTIRDSAGGGTITGGYATHGGGINISEDSALIFAGGTVTGNKATDGGGIYVKGTLVMTGGGVVRNNANDSGGGIYVTDNGRIDLTGADISYNRAGDNGGGIKAKLRESSGVTNCSIAYNSAGDYGGGIYLDASGKKLTIADSRIDHNSSEDDGAGIFLQNGTIDMRNGSLSDNYSENDGGGAKVTKGTTFTAANTVINGNTARDEEGGGVKTFGATKLSGCTISNNKAKKQGGGVFNDNTDGSKGSLTLENCTIVGNRSSDNNGGGVYSDHTLTLIGSEITGNYSAGRGGGIFIGDDSNDTYIQGKIIVKDNTVAAETGSDIYLRTHKLALTGALVDGACIGVTKENDSHMGVFTSGYGTYCGEDDPANYFFSPEGLEVVRGTGGEASLDSSWSELRAQLMNAADGSRIELTHNYTASSRDDCLEIPKGKTITIDLNGYTLNRKRTSADGDGHVIWVRENAKLILEDGTASSTMPGNGTITGGYSKRGGGIYVDTGATCTATGIQIKNNKASDDGAGLYVKGFLSATNCAIAFNTADDCGGGIFSEDTGSIALDNVEVTNNLAIGDDGGALHLFLGGDSSIANSRISYNQAGDCGGSVFLSAKGKMLEIRDTEINSNKSGDDGGGIYLDKGSIRMSGGSISKNKSANDSGGVKVMDGTTFTATDASICENKAGSEEGGGLKNYGTTTLTNCIINKNTAKKHGGGIFNDDSDDGAGKVTLSNCELSGNSSEDNGGAVYSDYRLVIIGGENAKITDNDADLQGDGIFVGKDSKEASIKGKIYAVGNDGNDVYLRKGQVLTIAGAITGTTVGIVDMEKTGTFTKGYSTYHNDVDPSVFFGVDPGAISAEWNEGHTEATLVSYWPDLQQQIDAAASAGADGDHVVTLDRSYTAGSSDDCLKVRKRGVAAERDGEVTIDLNGHTLNRNLTSKEDDGSVLKVQDGAQLTIIDSASAEGSSEGETESDEGESPTIGKITGGYASKGAGIYVCEGAVLNLQGGGIAGNHATDDGGGIYNEGTLNATGGYIEHNASDDSGAGICSTDDGSLNIRGVTIACNLAGDHGGGLYVKSSGVIENCTIADNAAADNGGALRLDAKGETLAITDTAITGNCSVDDGGGIYLHNGTINVTGGSISKNASSNDSGGVKVTEKTTFNAVGVEFAGNRANQEEGGALKNFGTVKLTNCLISDSRAGKEGGGLYNDGTMTLEGCTVKDNESRGHGGGVYSDEKLRIIGGSITGNRTEDFGGGVYLDDDSDPTGIQGNVVVQGNSAERFGNDLFMCSGRKLAVTGVLEGAGDGTSEAVLPAQIHVDLEKGTGVVTEGYKTHHETDAGEAQDPRAYFIAAVGYDVQVNGDGEVELRSDWKALKRRIENAASGTTIQLDKDYAAVPSDDRILIEDDKNITIDLAGHTLNRNRMDETGDGHVLEVDGGSTLTIVDSSADQTGAIMGGWAERGGGIYVNEKAVLNLQGGTVTGNRADTNGGGIYVRGALNFSGGVVSSNKTDGSGGGIFLTETGALNLEGGSVAENDAAKEGGGIQVSSTQSKMSVKGAPVVFGNHASERGTDISLPYQGLLTIAGQLTEDAKLGVALKDQKGKTTKFTQGYGQANGDDDPASYFISTEGYTVYAEGSEAVIGRKVYGESEYTSPFVSAGNQINADTDTLSGSNWMSGISGERYLNEINLPRSHDSGMNNVDEKYDADAQMGLTIGSGVAIGLSAVVAVLGILAAPFTFGTSAVAGIGLFAATTAVVGAVNLAVPTDWTSAAAAFADGRAADLAKTQNEYIDQMLEHGARHLDIRLNNCKKVYKFIGNGVFNGYTWSDDDENLWICHGKAGGGTYQALNPDDDYLSFSQVLDWTMEFLEEHPTETVIIDLSPETEKSEDHRTIYERARKILEAKALQTNPSTGEPFLYKEPGSDDYFAKYTHAPKLADCRGKIVIKAGGGEDFIDYIGGWDYASTGITKTGIGTYTNTPEELVDELQEFADQHSDPISLPTDAETHLDITWSWGLNSTAQSMGDVSYIFKADPPWENAKYVNPRVIGEGKLFGPDQAGQFFGTVSMDGFSAQYADQVWRTNFFDGLQYCTVTVKSGMDDPSYPDQTYKILRGTTLTIPGNIYKQLDGDAYFGGWQAQTSDGEDVACVAGSTFKVDEDVTFTAQWLAEGQVPVRVVWKDGNDADGLRPDSLSVEAQDATGALTALTLEESAGWSGVVDQMGDGGLTLKPVWGGVVISTENPYGEDAAGQYCYEESFAPGEGYTLTLTHTPADIVLPSGTIVWNDDNDAEGQRPASVTVSLLRDGEVIDAASVSAADGWQYAFEEQPLYENGEKLAYRVTQDEVDGYGTTIEGFSIVNAYAPDEEEAGQGVLPKAVQGVVQWDDSGDVYSKRPASVEVTLLANGEAIATQKATESYAGLWGWSFGELPDTDADGNEIVYGVSAQDVDGYHVTCDQFTYESSSDPSDSGVGTQSTDSGLFVITYTLQVASEDKTPATVLAQPESMALTYNGKERPLIKGGESEGGTMMYALGVDGQAQPNEDAFSPSVPNVTDAGTYYVWYYVKGDVLHTDSAYSHVEEVVDKAVQRVKSSGVEAAVGDADAAITATVTGLGDRAEGVGALSFQVVEGADVASVDEATGALTLLKAGTATVRVTAAETTNYAEASKDVTVTVLEGQGDDPTPPTPPDPPAPQTMISITFNANGGTGEMPVLTIAAGKTIKLPANGFSRDGYTFAGWNTKADGTGSSYEDEQMVSLSELGLSAQSVLQLQSGDGLRATADETIAVDLYAQWAEGGSSGTDDPTPGPSPDDPSPNPGTDDPQNQEKANGESSVSASETGDASNANKATSTQAAMPKTGDIMFGSLAVLLAVLCLACLIVAAFAARREQGSGEE